MDLKIVENAENGQIPENDEVEKMDLKEKMKVK